MANRGGSGCPMCGGRRSARYRPFCSRRCADLDLGRWFLGTYAIPVIESDDEAESLPEAESGEDDDDWTL